MSDKPRFELKDHSTNKILGKRIYDNKLERWYYDIDFDTTNEKVLFKICKKLNEIENEKEMDKEQSRFSVGGQNNYHWVIDWQEDIHLDCETKDDAIALCKVLNSVVK